MKEQRRNLQHQELLARREKYLVDRARKQQLEVERARNQPSPMAELRKLEMQDRLQNERAAKAQEKLERREAAQQKQTIKREAENKERMAWLEELLRDYDVEGNAPRQFNMSGSRRRVFLTPEVRKWVRDRCASATDSRVGALVAEHRPAAHRDADGADVAHRQVVKPRPGDAGARGATAPSPRFVE